MPRKKQYVEQEVIDKAMNLFWRNGYSNTSMQMLEKEMGINKFSIYSSFGNKHGVFLKSLDSYQERTQYIFDKFNSASNGVEDIKQFFYDSVQICTEEGNEKGCLLIGTYLEFSDVQDELVNHEINEFVKGLKEMFIEKLRLDKTKDEETIRKEANFLLLAKHGLVSATKVNDENEIRDYIEMTFKNIK